MCKIGLYVIGKMFFSLEILYFNWKEIGIYKRNKLWFFERNWPLGVRNCLYVVKNLTLGGENCNKFGNIVHCTLTEKKLEYRKEKIVIYLKEIGL